MAGDTEQRQLCCQLRPSHVAVEVTFAKEALHIKEHLPNLHLLLTILGCLFYGGLFGIT